MHVVVLADDGIAEAGDLLIAADHQPQGRGDVLRLDAEIGGAGAIDARAQLRLVQLQRRLGVDDAEVFGLGRQRLGVLGQLFELGPANREVDLAIAAADVERLQVADADAQVAELP